MKKWLVLVCVALLSGVLFFLWVADKQELGGRYFYLPSDEAVDMGYPGGPVVYKSAQKHLFSHIRIDGDLRGVNANGRFILAVRQPPAASAAGNAVPSKQPGLQYFVLIKASDAVYGPYNREEYAQQRTLLGVPQDLQVAAE
ncbi:hypothetical protein ACFP2F_17305 [Hymenobacter artigasi]|uniref:YxeA family protein n=1 Tax=Hymenobacter artigasi TaxID=2719616 RepID=A0ABX1HM55_9BACT|nr:hypothetical protein [Hymenobacter artigasi]NKI91336.1 hypothetical protein [Hymenobacter artigasi]